MVISRLSWDNYRDYEIGVERGVLYPKNSPGVVWNGLKSIREIPNTTLKVIYVDGSKSHQRHKTGHFSGVIETYAYPEGLYESILFSQEKIKNFGLSYRTQSGEGYKIHLVYNVLLAAGQRTHKIGEYEPFMQPFSTTPVSIPGGTRSAHVIIDTNVAHSWTVLALEEILYGTETEDPRLPSPSEVLELFEENSILQIIDHGDGTWTAIGPDDVIVMLDATTFQITWPSAVYVDAVSYTIHSL